MTAPNDPRPPLWLPPGSIRSILALLIVASAIVGVFVLDKEAATVLVGMAGIVTGFYFHARNREEGGDDDR